MILLILYRSGFEHKLKFFQTRPVFVFVVIIVRRLPAVRLRPAVPRIQKRRQRSNPAWRTQQVLSAPFWRINSNREKGSEEQPVCTHLPPSPRQGGTWRHLLGPTRPDRPAEAVNAARINGTDGRGCDGGGGHASGGWTRRQTGEGG